MSQWHYTQKGQKSGPIDRALLQGLISSGHVVPTDIAWRDGMTGWRAISMLPELTAPPIPQPAAVDYGHPARSGASDRSNNSADSVVASNYYATHSRAAGDYAGFWLRVGAHVIDELIVGIPFIFVICFIFGTDAFRPNNPYMTPMRPFIDLGFILTSWLYYALQESSPCQATFGKRILGLRVADMDGQQIGFVRASARFFGKILSGLICSIGYMMAGFTEKKQGLHDIIAGTFVVTNWG